jgi:hypothetical protein
MMAPAQSGFLGGWRCRRCQIALLSGPSVLRGCEFLSIADFWHDRHGVRHARKNRSRLALSLDVLGRNVFYLDRPLPQPCAEVTHEQHIATYRSRGVSLRVRVPANRTCNQDTGSEARRGPKHGYVRGLGKQGEPAALVPRSRWACCSALHSRAQILNPALERAIIDLTDNNINGRRRHDAGLSAISAGRERRSLKKPRHHQKARNEPPRLTRALIYQD